MNPLDLHIPTGNDLPPAEVPYYVLSKGGWLVHKPTLFGDVLVKTHTPPTNLPEVKPRIVPSGLKIPYAIVMQALSFFAWVFEEHKTEAMVLLTYNPTLNKWRCFVPDQWVTRGGVHERHNPEHIKPGWLTVGSIHSHCDFGAFHSGTDTHDADDFDGIHMTIGHVNDTKPQFAQMLAFNKQHFSLSFEEAVDIPEDTRSIPDRDCVCPEWWMRYVHPHESPPWKKEHKGDLTLWNSRGTQQGTFTPAYGSSYAARTPPVITDDIRAAIKEYIEDLKIMEEMAEADSLKIFWNISMITEDGRVGPTITSSYAEKTRT